MPDDSEPPSFSATGEDVDMESADVVKPDAMGDVPGVAQGGSWKPVEFGLIGHTEPCAICQAMREHFRLAMGNGETSSIIEAVQDMLEKSHARMQLPIMSIDDWAASLSPVLDTTPEPSPITPMSWLTYLANSLPAEIALLAILLRPCNRVDYMNERELQALDRARVSRTRLLRDVMATISKLQALALPRLYTPLADDTPPAILNELPRRVRGVGEPRYSRRAMYPVFRTIKTVVGDILCALPSRTLSPFEVIDGDGGHSLILPGGPNGHPHIPGSLWNFVPRVPCTEAQLRAGGVSTGFQTDEELIRLFIEAFVIPWLLRSLQQRAFVRWFIGWMMKQHGDGALDVTCEALCTVDLDEQGYFWSRSRGLVPDFVFRKVVGNSWHWDEVGVQVWAIMAAVFPENTEKAVAALRHPRDPYVTTKPVPQYFPKEFVCTETPIVYTYSMVRDHLVYECGIEVGDLKYFHDVARQSESLTYLSENAQESMKWNTLRAKDAIATTAQLELTFDETDLPLTAVDAHHILAFDDRRRDAARRNNAPPAQPSRHEGGSSSSSSAGNGARGNVEHSGTDRAASGAGHARTSQGPPPPPPPPPKRVKRVADE